MACAWSDQDPRVYAFSKAATPAATAGTVISPEVLVSYFANGNWLIRRSGSWKSTDRIACSQQDILSIKHTLKAGPTSSLFVLYLRKCGTLWIRWPNFIPESRVTFLNSIPVGGLTALSLKYDAGSIGRIQKGGLPERKDCVRKILVRYLGARLSF